MIDDLAFPIGGGCSCREVRYRMESRPLFVHCCHCKDCQRQTGSAFVLNALFEADRVDGDLAQNVFSDPVARTGNGVSDQRGGDRSMQLSALQRFRVGRLSVG